MGLRALGIIRKNDQYGLARESQRFTKIEHYKKVFGSKPLETDLLRKSISRNDSISKKHIKRKKHLYEMDNAHDDVKRKTKSKKKIIP